MQRSAPNPALLALVTGALGLRPQQVLAAQVLDNGPRWLALLLPSAELVLTTRGAQNAAIDALAREDEWNKAE